MKFWTMPAILGAVILATAACGGPEPTQPAAITAPVATSALLIAATLEPPAAETATPSAPLPTASPVPVATPVPTATATPIPTNPPTATPTPTPPKSYNVFKGDTIVMWIEDAPGAVLSTAPPPPDDSLTIHPWLTGHAFAAEEEGQLGTLLRAANNFDEFVSLLKQAGYQLVEADK